MTAKGKKLPYDLKGGLPASVISVVVYNLTENTNWL